MPKETNKVLNPYYFELLKFLVVYKLKNRINNEISTEEREELANELNAYNTPDSLNRIFSKGSKRRQNFNTSSLTGLCFFLGYTDWNEFLRVEYVAFADDYEGKLYNDLDNFAKQRIHSFIILRILKQAEQSILSGLEEYIKKLAKHINKNEISETSLAEIWNYLITCINIICKQKKTGWLDVLYKIAENVELGRKLFNDLELPPIFITRFNEILFNVKNKDEIDKRIELMPNSIEKDIISFYRKNHNDDEIEEYFKLLGADIAKEKIQQLRWHTAELIFKKLK